MLKIQKLDLLLSIYIFCIAVTELMGAKTFPIVNTGFLKLNASVAIFIIPVIFTITDVVIEVHGRERAHSIIRSGLIVVFLILLYSILATALPPSKRFATSEASYDDIFGKSARIAAASLTAFAISAFLDAAVFLKIRELLGKKALWFRNNVSNFASQFTDTVLFITLAFYAIDKGFAENFGFLVSLIIPYWFLKCTMSVIQTPIVYLGVNWLKEKK